jgi:FkbH-like protein
MWEEVKSQYISATQTGAVKLVIVDLDDTLWRGVLAERTAIDPADLEGWPLGIAEALLYLRQRGIILAIASKNDEKYIRESWPRIFSNRLFLDDFSCVKINWKNKAENISEIINEVNVLPESVVFVDDNPVERELVMESIPGIRTIGADLYSIRRIFLWSPELQPTIVTEESSNRGEMIKLQIQREESRKIMDRDTFIRNLNIVYEEVYINNDKHPQFDRVFELLNKTNQFNTTGKRWSLGEINEEFKKGLEIFAFKVSDKFTSYGLVGMAMVVNNIISQFVMSCRVIGLDVELMCINKIKERKSIIQGVYFKNEKNYLAEDLFKRAGFENNGDAWIWKDPMNYKKMHELSKS